MKWLVVFFLLTISSSGLFAQDSVRIYGHVTDFSDYPIDSVTVRVKNKSFENLYETITDKNGYYSLTVLKNTYASIYAIKLNDYGKTKLEYWAWNIPVYNDLEINPKYERMEMYGMNAFEPQVSPFETYMVYFRPMSLTKALEFQEKNNNNDAEHTAVAEMNTINIAPNSVSEDELRVFINDLESEVVDINKVTEFARGTRMYGYIIQIRKPEYALKRDPEYDKISVILHSKETDEYGMGECFIKKSK